MSAAPTAMRHRFVQGTITGGPLQAMLQGQTADVLYSSPPWDDAHVKMYYGGPDRQKYSWQSFFHAFTGVIQRNVDGWVFIEAGVANVDVAAEMLSEVTRNVIVHSTDYGPRKAPLANRLLVAHTSQPVNGWAIPEGCDHGGPRQPLGILRSVTEPGQVLLDPCCTNVYGAQAARKLGLAFLGNEHNPNRFAAIRRVLEA